jgi:hypothetical protein
MNSAGYLFLLVGVFVLRQVAVGRAQEIPADAKALFSSLINFDFEGMGTVLAGRGENVSVDSSGPVASDGSTDTPVKSGGMSLSGVALATEAQKLGAAAKGYSLGKTGPDYYDCSGLLWRAGYNLGIYKGARYTTSTFRSIAGSWCEKVSAVSPGDIILWPGKHMGICTGTNEMYSARSPDKGIGTSSISGDAQYFGAQPEYWRVK